MQPAFARRSAAPRPLTWKSTDGREIEGLLTYPAGYEAGTRVPLLLSSTAARRASSSAASSAAPSPYPLAAFAARGYAVLRVNPRGSSGYGKEFRHANRRDWGGGDYQD